MERISYAGDDLLTGTAIARAVLAYAEALATREASATVEIPVRLSDGSVEHASVLIGPASQLISRTVPDDGHEELVDEELVDRIVTLTQALGISRPLTEDPDADDQQLDDLDILSYDPSDGRDT